LPSKIVGEALRTADLTNKLKNQIQEFSSFVLTFDFTTMAACDGRGLKDMYGERKLRQKPTV